ncbi:hypothetical protein PL8927_50014 [Planktothrix serta PCC 8927]|uniref:Uncharacterized protein n=1 Tax=Planktothrix serta PCC 8927 TaxID=671068 RepID=A0A7Z9DY78_9CYAN|nr:hypothetical protein PL8927_50014 [Planktothrix serta PCC 8927]
MSLTSGVIPDDRSVYLRAEATKGMITASFNVITGGVFFARHSFISLKD